MKRLCTACVLGLSLSGCGSEPASTPAPADAPTARESSAVDSLVAADQIELYLYRTEITATGELVPSFYIKASSIAQSTENAAVEDAECIIYAEEEGGNVHLDAPYARADIENDRVVMEQGVTLTRGLMIMETEALEWLNKDRVAVSKHPITLTNGETRISAASMRYYVDEERWVFKKPHGKISTSENVQP